ncbi:MAG TPA: MGMT family protein [Candidatus Paceibacterota bacterium]
MHKAILLLRKIPKGKVVTYKEMARVCHTSPRAIGRIMAKNADPVGYPCYKVVSSKGELCGYSATGGPPAGETSLKAKRRLLEKEGIIFINSRVPVKYFWRFDKE